jgi:two-component sensor histidine kinase
MAIIAQKDTLLKEVNHRVQNSLQLVVAFLAMQARAGEDETLTQHLTEAQRRLSAVALVHRRLYADDNVETVDLARYLDDLIADLKSSMGDEWAGRLSLDLAPILIPADAAVQVGLILVELVTNARKYAYGGDAGPITVALKQHRARFRLIVADRGVGRAGTRNGFGTRMLRSMVDRLQGTLEEENNRPGLRIIVSAPLDQRREVPA